MSVGPIVNALASRLLGVYDLRVAILRAVVHAGDKTNGDARSWYMISRDAKSWRMVSFKPTRSPTLLLTFSSIIFSFDKILSQPEEAPSEAKESQSLGSRVPLMSEEFEASEPSGTRTVSSHSSVSLDSTAPLSPDYPRTHASPTATPTDFCSTVGPHRYHGTSELIEDTEGESSKPDSKRGGSEDESSDSNDERESHGLDDESHGSDDESHGLDDESHGVYDKSHGLDNEGHGLEDEGQGLEDRGPGLGYEAAMRRALELTEEIVPSMYEVGQSSRSVLEQEGAERISTFTQPTLITWVDLEDGRVYTDILTYVPPTTPIQTPSSLEWSLGSLLVSQSSPIVPSPIALPVAIPAATISRLDALPPTLFEGYDRDIRELYTRRQIAEERHKRLELTDRVARMEMRHESKGEYYDGFTEVKRKKNKVNKADLQPRSREIDGKCPSTLNSFDVLNTMDVEDEGGTSSSKGNKKDEQEVRHNMSQVNDHDEYDDEVDEFIFPEGTNRISILRDLSRAYSPPMWDLKNIQVTYQTVALEEREVSGMEPKVPEASNIYLRESRLLISKHWMILKVYCKSRDFYALCGDHLCGYHHLSRVCPIVNAPAGRLLGTYDLGVATPRAMVHAGDKTSGDARCVLIKVNGWYWSIKMCTLRDLGSKTEELGLGSQPEARLTRPFFLILRGLALCLSSIIKDHNGKNKSDPIMLDFDEEDTTVKDMRIVKGKEVVDDDLRKPFKEVLKTPLTRKIIEFVGPEYKMSNNIKLYDGTTDPDDHLASRWFKYLPANNIDEWAALREAFTTRYSVRKACFKEPHEITKIVRNANESLTEFKERWTVETGFIMGVPEIMKISSFMDSLKCQKLAKCFSDKAPTTVNEMMKRLDDFFLSEKAFAQTKLSKGKTREQHRKSYFLPVRKDDRPLNNNHVTDQRRWLEAALESSKVNHLIKDVRQKEKRIKGRWSPAGKDNQHEDISDEPLLVKAEVEGYLVRRIYIDGGASVEVMFEHCFENLSPVIKAMLKETQTDLVGFTGEATKPLGIIELEVCFRSEGLCRRTTMKFTVIRSPYLTMRLEKKQVVEKENDEGVETKAVNVTKEILVHPAFPDQLVVIVGGFPKTCKAQIIEHNLNVNASIEPERQKHRVLAPEKSEVVARKVGEWVKAGDKVVGGCDDGGSGNGAAVVDGNDVVTVVMVDMVTPMVRMIMVVALEVCVGCGGDGSGGGGA
nr:reverse transcriptase domain-containing protein [Tanacetum cinerariifolium]